MTAKVPGLALPAALLRFVGYRVVIAAIVGAFAGGVLFGAGLMPRLQSATTGLIVGIVLVPAIGHLVLGQTGRRIAEAYLWYSDHAVRDWRERTGTSVPRTQGQVRKWLAANPPSDRNRSVRVSAQLLVGDIAAARAEQLTRPKGSVADRVDATLDDWLIEIWVGGDAPLATGDELVADVSDDERRTHALRDLLMLRAMDRAHRREEWQPYFLHLREVIGSAADGYLWRRFWPLITVAVAILYALGVLFASIGGIGQ